MQNPGESRGFRFRTFARRRGSAPGSPRIERSGRQEIGRAQHAVNRDICRLQLLTWARGYGSAAHQRTQVRVDEAERRRANDHADKGFPEHGLSPAERAEPTVLTLKRPQGAKAVFDVIIYGSETVPVGPLNSSRLLRDNLIYGAMANHMAAACRAREAARRAMLLGFFSEL